LAFIPRCQTIEILRPLLAAFIVNGRRGKISGKEKEFSAISGYYQIMDQGNQNSPPWGKLENASRPILVLPPGSGKTTILASWALTNATLWRQYRAQLRKRITVTRVRLTVVLNGVNESDNAGNWLDDAVVLPAHAIANPISRHSRLSGVIANLQQLVAILKLARSVLSRLASLSRCPVVASHKAVSERKFFVLHETHPPEVAVDSHGLLLGAFQTA
jgi:hypothetical protein